MKKKLSIVDNDQGQFLYLGRWVNKKSFRAFIYDSDGKEKLADSYEEFQDLISSGIWFAEKTIASKERKQKDVVCTTD